MIEKSILDTVSKFDLFANVDTVTVALSGGADSMCLLNALVNLKDILNINVKAAHLNHLIRGDEAYRDEEFVKRECEKLGIELIIERIDVPKIAKEQHQSLELAARNVRYNFFKRINQGVIATAHTASDNLETIIFNLTRGTAIDGLCGIPVKRDIYVRPLINSTRETVENYCNKQNIAFVTDSTNLSDEYTRNKIRHSVIPTLKELNPSVEKSVLRTCSSLREISDEIKTQAKLFLGSNKINDKLSLESFENLETYVGKRVIVEYIKSVDKAISLENHHIENIYKICISGGKTNIPKDKYCFSDKNTLTVLDINKKNDIEFIVSITKNNVDFLDSTKNVNNLFLNNSLDYDKIIGKLSLRTRQNGDKIRLMNRGCTKPLTKLYNECGIPTEIREKLPVIADDMGVVWIHDIGVSQRCCVTEKTKEAYLIEVNKKEI